MVRVRELITLSVLDRLGYDYMEVLITQMFIARR
jgi:hypothetical protein